MRDLLTEICVEAGRLLLGNFHLRSGLALREKQDAGWVTRADERSEALILESLGRATPDASVVAEESGARQGSGELTWYVNPLDGTTNFTRGLDYFSVFIAGVVGGELRHAVPADHRRAVLRGARRRSVAGRRQTSTGRRGVGAA